MDPLTDFEISPAYGTGAQLHRFWELLVLDHSPYGRSAEPRQRENLPDAKDS